MVMQTHLLFFIIGVILIVFGFEGMVILSDFVKKVPYGKPKRIDDYTTSQTIAPPIWYLAITSFFAVGGIIMIFLALEW
jgi:hypothetical protein